MTPEERPRILLVDDEPRVLQGLKRHLYRAFDLEVATSAQEGVRALKGREAFAVVVSDLRMPGMDGVAFLKKVHELAPDTTRVLLTGNSDMAAAIAAVNDAEIYRFLSKPCPAKQLQMTLEAGVEQHRLRTDQRILLEQTLHGSIKMLTELLALADPEAFGRATRVKAAAVALAERLGAPERWQMETAAMLSRIGFIALPTDTLAKLARGAPLTSAEQDMVEQVPEVTEKLLAPIPRLEGVRAILRYQAKRFDGEGRPEDDVRECRLPMGARILKLLLDFDALEAQGVPCDAALEKVERRTGWYDPQVLQTFRDFHGRDAAGEVVRELLLRELRPGMVLVDTVLSADERVLVVGGLEVTDCILERLRNFAANLGVKEPMRVLVARPDAVAPP